MNSGSNCSYLLCLLTLLGFTTPSHDALGETLIVGTNQPVNFSLIVPTNQALIVYGGQFRAYSPDIFWRITQSGTLHLFRLDSISDPILDAPSGHPNILAGPLNLELFIPMTSEFEGSWMSYQILPLAGLNTIVVRSSRTNVITVPAGKNLRIISRQSRNFDGEMTLHLLSGDARAQVAFDSFNSNSLLGLEFTGPVALEIVNNGTYNQWLTYSLQNASVQLLPSGVIASSGSGALVVEESSDLMNWFTSAVMLKDAMPSKYFRLRASK